MCPTKTKSTDKFQFWMGWKMSDVGLLFQALCVSRCLIVGIAARGEMMPCTFLSCASQLAWRNHHLLKHTPTRAQTNLNFQGSNIHEVKFMNFQTQHKNSNTWFTVALL